MVLVAGGMTSAYNVDDGPPEVTTTLSPKIPPQAEEAGVGGSVTMLVLVREDGSVGPATVMNCDPCDLGFESSALRSVRRWRFLPAREEGAFVEAYTVVEVDFQATDAVRRARYRDSDWSFVSTTYGGAFRSTRWNYLAQWQRDRQSRAYEVWRRDQWQRAWEFAGVLPGQPWYWGTRSGVLKSPVVSGGGYLPWPNGTSEPEFVRPTRVGEMYQRRASGPEPIQLVGSPGVVRPTSSMSSRPSAPSRSMTSMTRRSAPTVTRRAPTRSTRPTTTRRATSTSTSRTRQK